MGLFKRRKHAKLSVWVELGDPLGRGNGFDSVAVCADSIFSKCCPKTVFSYIFYWHFDVFKCSTPPHRSMRIFQNGTFQASRTCNMVGVGPVGQFTGRGDSVVALQCFQTLNRLKRFAENSVFKYLPYAFQQI